MFLSALATGQECSSLEGLDLLQKSNLQRAYLAGQPYDYGYTLAAIAWQESSAGRFRLNLSSNDLGMYQINANTANKVMGVTNHYKQLELHQQLIYDDRLGAYIAISVLEHFRKDRPLTKVVYDEIIMSYNTGYGWKKDKKVLDKATRYRDNLTQKVKTLIQCKEKWL